MRAYYVQFIYMCKKTSNKKRAVAKGNLL